MFATAVLFIMVTAVLVSWNLVLFFENRYLSKHLRSRRNLQ